MAKNKFQLVFGGHVVGGTLLPQGTIICSDDNLVEIHGEKFKLLGPCDENCNEIGCEVKEVKEVEPKKKAPKA